jgi:ubiquinone biosynthesis protein
LITPHFSFTLDQARKLINGLSDQTPAGMSAMIRSAAGRMGQEPFQAQAACELIRAICPADMVPQIYQDYRQIFHDGLKFFFAHIHSDRLIGILADQILTGHDADPEQRIARIARQIPTLHKLGQTLARNRNISPGLRQRLIALENGIYQAQADPLIQRVSGELNRFLTPFSIVIDRCVLAEASVAEVIGFSWTSPDTHARSRGVFKILKPGIREKLAEEFGLLDRLAVFFHQNRTRYPLKDFRFIETFRDIKAALEDEVNLSGEQARLTCAARFFKGEESVSIPKLIPCFCTPDITAMEEIPGGKITETAESSEQKHGYARNLFQALIWRPVFSADDETLFHGDPHAGNILSAKGRAAILDWSLAGTLSKIQRIGIVRLMLSMMMEDPHLIRKAVANLSNSAPPDEKLADIISDIMNTPEYAQVRFLKRAFFFIDQTALRGIGYPQSLLLFRKAFFTLDGVLNDLAPDFSMDDFLMRHLEGLFRQEAVKRWMYMFMPGFDAPENYSSLLSNQDLQSLFIRFFEKNLKKGMNLVNELTGKNAALAWRQMELMRVCQPY